MTLQHALLLFASVASAAVPTVTLAQQATIKTPQRNFWEENPRLCVAKDVAVQAVDSKIPGVAVINDLSNASQSATASEGSSISTLASLLTAVGGGTEHFGTALARKSTGAEAAMLSRNAAGAGKFFGTCGEVLAATDGLAETLNSASTLEKLTKSGASEEQLLGAKLEVVSSAAKTLAGVAANSVCPTFGSTCAAGAIALGSAMSTGDPELDAARANILMFPNGPSELLLDRQIAEERELFGEHPQQVWIHRSPVPAGSGSPESLNNEIEAAVTSARRSAIDGMSRIESGNNGDRLLQAATLTFSSANSQASGAFMAAIARSVTDRASSSSTMPSRENLITTGNRIGEAQTSVTYQQPKSKTWVCDELRRSTEIKDGKDCVRSHYEIK